MLPVMFTPVYSEEAAELPFEEVPQLEEYLNLLANLTYNFLIKEERSLVCTEAYNQIILAIENFKVLNKDYLSLPCNLDSSIYATTLQIQAFMIKLEEGSLTELLKEVNQFISTLPFTHQTQVARARSYIFDDKKDKFILNIEGNFPCAKMEGFEPTFSLGDKIYPAIATGMNCLVFEVLIESIRCQDMGTLSIPWNAGWGCSVKREAANYRILLNTFYPGPGKIKLFFTTQKVRMQEKQFTSAKHSFEGKPWDRLPLQYTFAIWSKNSITSEPEIKELSAAGHVSIMTRPVDEHCIDCTVTLKARDALTGASNCDFRVAFDVKKLITLTHSQEEEIQIGWGQTRRIEFGEGGHLERIDVLSMDGSLYRYDGSNNIPYLQICEDHEGVTLSAGLPIKV